MSGLPSIVLQDIMDAVWEQKTSKRTLEKALHALPTEQGEHAALKVLHSLQDRSALANSAARCCVDYLLSQHQWNPARYLSTPNQHVSKEPLRQWVVQFIGTAHIDYFRSTILQTWNLENLSGFETETMKFNPILSHRTILALYSLSIHDLDAISAQSLVQSAFDVRQHTRKAGLNVGTYSRWIATSYIRHAIKVSKSRPISGAAGPSSSSRKRARDVSSDVEGDEDAEEGEKEEEEEDAGKRRAGTSHEGETGGHRTKRQRAIDKRLSTLSDCERCSVESQERLANYLRAKPKSVYLPSEDVDTLLLDLDFTQICHIHQRSFANACGLRNSIKRKVLRRLFEKIQEITHAVYIANVAHRDTLIKALQASTVVPDQMRFALRPIHQRQRDYTHLIRHVAGADAFEKWQTDGTLVIDDVVDFLEPVQDIIDQEFNLYHHHYHPAGLKKGWLRNMYYSLIQQVIRADPLVYGINVALRGDHNHRLVACGYGTKYAGATGQVRTGDSTGFLHMDADLVALVERGINKNMLTCGISLDHEDDNNCTVVVPGTHLHSARMLEILREKGVANTQDVTTTDFAKTWSKHLAGLFGKPVSVPCKRYGLRISHVAVVHGSTSYASTPRRVVFPWYLGYGDDYKHSDIPNTHTWLEQQINHSECVPPTLEPSGKSPSNATPPVLAWSVPMTFRHALGEATLARKKYEDPRVQLELDQLFSEDIQVHKTYVKKAREDALVVFRETWQLVKDLERRATVDGKDSFFRSGQTGH